MTIGLRVLVRRSTEADVTGEIVEDDAAATDPGGGGHEWAPVHRWAIALDDGRLIFADTEDLTIDPGSYRSAPDSNPDPDSAVRIPRAPSSATTAPHRSQCHGNPTYISEPAAVRVHPSHRPHADSIGDVLDGAFLRGEISVSFFGMGSCRIADVCATGPSP